MPSNWMPPWSDSRRDSVSRSETRLLKRIDWSRIFSMKRWCVAGSMSRSSISVSTNPRIAASGVLSSCEMLATKSRRTPSSWRRSLTSCSTTTAPTRSPLAFLSGEPMTWMTWSFCIFVMRASDTRTRSSFIASLSASLTSTTRVTSQMRRPCELVASMPRIASAALLTCTTTSSRSTATTPSTMLARMAKVTLRSAVMVSICDLSWPVIALSAPASAPISSLRLTRMGWL